MAKSASPTSWRDALKIHPAAELLPMMGEDELRALGEDIKRNGLQMPIVVCDDMVLDGRNRLDAMELVGMKPITDKGDVNFPRCYGGGEDPYAFVISANIRRRHFSAEQNPELIANLLKATPEKSNRQIAEAVKVDHKTVASVRAEKQATGEIPQLTKTVGKDGRQRQQPAKKPPAASLTERRVRMEAKAERRAEREIQLAQRTEAMPSRRFAVIYADAAWRFEPYSRETGMDRAADNHYPTMTTAEIAAMDIASIAAPDCVLFMWATVPMLPDALEVMKAWSFTYKSHIVWDKGRIGTGYWTRNRHELLLIGTRGDTPAPAMGQQPESLIAAPLARTRRSRIALQN